MLAFPAASLDQEYARGDPKQTPKLYQSVVRRGFGVMIATTNSGAPVTAGAPCICLEKNRADQVPSADL
jgi:hypothetical protein